ncbi:MAG: ATP-binding cassette domain-containing protein, partial [Cytophagales bacterium]|nr:ATP-binding cassette domain-containing protein [Cytophagales bacterium]
MEQEALLTVENLSVRFGNSHAVRGISFSIGRGEILGVVGESGSGKSVTMMSALGLVSGGDITGKIDFQSREYGKLDLLSASDNQLQRIRGNEIAMVFQEPMTSLNPVYTCGDQVMEALIWHKKITKSEAKEQT